jgi:hypothetical protein
MWRTTPLVLPDILLCIQVSICTYCLIGSEAVRDGRHLTRLMEWGPVRLSDPGGGGSLVSPAAG